jgi:hypothetical protein
MRFDVDGTFFNFKFKLFNRLRNNTTDPFLEELPFHKL